MTKFFFTGFNILYIKRKDIYMKVNFNTNKSTYSPNFGKLIVEEPAAKMIKRQYNKFNEETAKQSKHYFLQSFEEAFKTLNELPLICFLKAGFQGKQDILALEVKDVKEAYSDDTRFLNANTSESFAQEKAGDVAFLKKAMIYAKDLHKNNQDLIGIFKNHNIEVVDSSAKSKIPFDDTEI